MDVGASDRVADLKDAVTQANPQCDACVTVCLFFASTGRRKTDKKTTAG